MCTSLVDHDLLHRCENCEATECKSCAAQVFQNNREMPPAALSNYIIICYTPKELQEHDIIVMERMGASV